MGEPMRIAISKLNGGNYQVWKFKMELLLIKEELWDQVKTTVPTEAAAASAWKKKDDKARATICLLVEDSQLMHIRKATTAKEAWDSLKEYHEKSTLTSKVYLLRQICNLKLSETGNMEQHIATMQELVDKLAALGEEIKDHFFVAILLSSLPETYGTLITALESRPEAELTLDFVKGKLLDEYRRRKGVPDLDNDNTAMKASQNNSATSEKGQKMCFFCHKIGHFKQDCIKFKRWKLKKEKANQAESSKNSSDFLCFSAYQEERKKELWYIDSGATSHMTNNRAAFKSLVLKKLPDVTLANGRGTKAFGIGTVITKCLDGNNKETNVELRDVLYVPDLTNNLLSVKKLTEKGLTVQFKDSGCKIIKGDLIVARASLISGMYVFRATSKAFVASGSSHSINCQHTWHRRFGHRNIHDIQQLQEKFVVSGIKIQDCGIREICGCCAKDRTLMDYNTQISQKLPSTDASKQHSSKSTADQMSAKHRIAGSKLGSKFVSVSGPNGKSPEILRLRLRSGRDDTFSGNQSSSSQEQRGRDHFDMDIIHKLYFERDMPGWRDQKSLSDFGVVTLDNPNVKRAPAQKNKRKKKQQMQAVPQFNRLDETRIDDHLRIRLENMALKKTPREELQRMFRCKPCCCPISQVNNCISTSKTH